MTVTLDSLDERIRRVEVLLRERVAVEPVRALSVERCAELTGIPVRHIQRAIRTGELPAIPAGDDPRNSRLRVVRPADLDQWLAWREIHV